MTCVGEFLKHMDRLRALSPDAWAWLSRIPRYQWSRAFFRRDSKCDMVLNNMCESFNNFILEARDKPILTCLEIIRTKLMVRIAAKSEVMNKWTSKLCPNIERRLERSKAMASGCWVLHAGLMEFQVDASEGQFAVHLGNNTCSCQKWQLTGLPCAHAIAALAKNGNPIEDSVHQCYSVDTFKKVYSNIIHPLRSMDQWADVGHELILPPTVGAPRPGRPKKKRVRAMDEPAATGARVQERMRRTGMIMHCKKCGIAGHNKRKCTSTSAAFPSQTSVTHAPAEASTSAAFPGHTSASEAP